MVANTLALSTSLVNEFRFGYNHFFNTFARFGSISTRHLGEWLDELATRARRQNEQYLELMHTPDFSRTAKAGYEIGWRDDFGHFRDALLAKDLTLDITAARKELDEAEAFRAKREHCGEPGESSVCQVKIRYLCQVLRGFPKQQVFAQTILCFELASADSRFVGINFVMPEDGYISMTDYELQMRMVGFLHGLYPKVHISLHAGEIAPGLVPYEGLCCHIRLAVEHGAETLARIVARLEGCAAASGVLLLLGLVIGCDERFLGWIVVIGRAARDARLTSNDMILGVAGKDHPFPLYRQFGVPFAFSTDDEGVSRIDLTHEYVRAVESYDLHYIDLKQSVRTSLEHDFLPGASLWASPDQFSSPVTACVRDQLGGEKPSVGCASFLKSSEKAQEQWELERRFHAFESSL